MKHFEIALTLSARVACGVFHHDQRASQIKPSKTELVRTSLVEFPLAAQSATVSTD
jgi:hypothetical protein